MILHFLYSTSLGLLMPGGVLYFWILLEGVAEVKNAIFILGMDAPDVVSVLETFSHPLLPQRHRCLTSDT